MLIFGWTYKQYAYAKGRYDEAKETALAEDGNGLLELQRWWRLKGWPEPLSIKLEGVDYRSDLTWAINAVSTAIVRR